MSAAATKRPLKFLCVDDEADILEIVAEIIGGLGFEVLKATDVQSALHLIAEHEARLVGVVSDLNMPSESGLDLRQQMLDKNRQIPFLILSGYVDREIALRGVDLKIAAFLDKPFEKNALLEVVKREVKDRTQAIFDEDELLDGFAVEALTLIEEMESIFLGLEGVSADIESINRIFACAHTIKGASGYFKPDDLHRFSHSFEDFLVPFKANPDAMGTGTISICLKAVDILKDLLADLGADRPKVRDIAALRQVFVTVDADAPNASAGRRQAGTRAVPEGKSADVRVPLAQLDEFMEKSGEITVLRNMINKTVRLIEKESSGNAQIAVLGELLSEMHKANSVLQERVVDLRKVQLRQLFKPLNRTLRDLCVGLRKEISLRVSGDELRVDHALAEGLSKCLIHMLRNAADHGIESAEIRQTAGKPAPGNIEISVESQSDFIHLRVSDDGKGIDPERIREKAIEKGILDAVTAAQLAPEDVLMLIFHPGFSTAEKVTDVSGRGVGMDMVKTTIDAMGGSIGIESRLGQGTTFAIRLPLPKSVVIVSSLMVRAGNQLFALPQDAILRVIKMDGVAYQSQIRMVNDCRFFLDGDRLKPVLRLESLLDLQVQPVDEGVLLVLRGKNGEYCLEVDEIQDIEDTVVKRVGRWMDRLGLFSGATFLGDGRIGLILDVEGMSETLGFKKKDLKPPESVVSCHTTLGLPVLMVESAERRFYGIPLENIFRIEELEVVKFQRSGQSSVIVYRDRVVPVTSLEQLLGREPGEIPVAGERIPAVLLKIDDHLHAVAVHRIGDLVNAEESTLKPAMTSGNGLQGVIAGQVTIVLDVQNLLKRRSGSIPANEVDHVA